MDIKTAQNLFIELRGQLAEIDETHRDENKLDAFKRRAYMLIKQVFGPESLYLTDLNDIGYVGFYDDKESDYRESWARGWHKADNLISTMLEELHIQENSLPEAQSHGAPTSKRVFVVHGHDEEMKQKVARTLEALHLVPIILHEQPSKGRTIIEKLADYADVSFAVVLLSPDDLGYSKTDKPENAKFRARQNVILELGYFLGLLGRDGVLPLFAEENKFDIPSDYQGVVFTKFDELGGWKLSLVKEIQARGFDIDANDLTRS